MYNEIWSKLKKATRKEKDDLKKTLVNILAQIIYDNIIETNDYESPEQEELQKKAD